MKFFIFFWIFFLFTTISFSSSWHSLGYGTSYLVTTLYVDSFSNRLLVGGGFTEVDSMSIRGIASWNGTAWDSLGGGIIYAGAQRNMAIVSYQSKIYSDGRFFAGQTDNFGASFDGVNWQALQGGVNGNIFQMREANGLLYVGGSFNSVNNGTCHILASWNGSIWNCLNVPYENELDDFEFWNGGLILGGNFFDSLSNNIDIAFYDSTTQGWTSLGGGIQGGFSAVHALAIYQNELYVAGYFQSAAGNAGDNIMRWDGSQWNDVGGGTDNEIYTMKVFKDELYIGGVFQNCGNIYTGGLAKWNGSQWNNVTNSVFYPYIIEDIAFWNNELYVGGYFHTIDSVAMENIARYDGPLSVEDLSTQQFDFKASYNSNNKSVSIIFSLPTNKDGEILLTDILSRKQMHVYIPRHMMRKEIDMQELSSGVYLIIVNIENKVSMKKIIKDN